MPRNENAKTEAAEFIRKLNDLAHAKMRNSAELNRMSYTGSARLDTIAELAKSLGFYLVVQPPEETENKWYAMGGKWRDILKSMVFHFLERENAELVASGREKLLDAVHRDTEISEQLHQAGLNTGSFNEWLCRMNGKKPSLESVFILADFEGFKLDWREMPKGESV